MLCNVSSFLVGNMSHHNIHRREQGSDRCLVDNKRRNRREGAEFISW